MSELHTWMRHTDHGGQWEAPTVLVKHYEQLGWEVMDHPPTEPQPAIDGFVSAADAPAPATKDEPTFDPADHTVAEVEEHLAEHPDDEQRVVEAEEASEHPRTSIVGKSE
jgi:hypothetical protein